ncbi:MAG: DUF4012 domain-containing protein [Actinomycetota bacterium]|nr:DUF4012 domain-containing protein [Actinomycetota bacterium]
MKLRRGHPRRPGRRRRLGLAAVVGVVVLLAALSAYVAIPVAGRLQDAAGVLAAPGDDLDEGVLEQARADLVAAESHLDGVAAKVLGILPVARQNLEAARSVTGAAVPAVDAALALRREVDSLVEADLITAGTVDTAAVASVAEELNRQSEALAGVEAAADGALGGWLLPPLWDRVAELSATAEELAQTTDDAADVLAEVPDILGEDVGRRYLVLLLNNAELRGAGGILSGVGTLRAVDGRLSLRRLFPRESLVTDPLVEVPAPPAYERIYGDFDANTTLWINVPYSPDLEETAAVAAALWEERVGQGVSGVVFVDPRGLATLLDPGTTLTIGDSGTTVTAAELPDFVYSDAYQAFDSESERRLAILQAGADAFRSFLDAGAGGEDGFRELGDAIAGGHLAFVSLRPDEQAALTNVTTAAIEPHQVRVVSHNLGDGTSAGTKLDFWVKRRVRHECRVHDDGAATCSTRVSFENTVPDGLGTYVGGTPYGVLNSNLQLFLPQRADVQRVVLDGEEPLWSGRHYGPAVLVTMVTRVAQRDTSTAEVVYEVPPRPDGEFLIELVPQPLPRDAELDARVWLPHGWRSDDLEPRDDGAAGWSGTFDQPVTLSARLPERSGLPALWARLERFWDEPVF